MNIRNILNTVAGFFSRNASLPPIHKIVITHNGNVVGGHVSITTYNLDDPDIPDPDRREYDRLSLPDHSIFGIDCIFDGSDKGQASMISGKDDYTNVMSIGFGDGSYATFNATSHCEICAHDVGLTTYIVKVHGMMNFE